MNFSTDILSLFDKKWALVTAGDIGNFNTMTISWGGMGTIWNKPVVTVYVKPIRYTHDFLEKNGLFTVSFFGGEYRKALGLLGSKSGRDVNKVALSGLTPTAIADGAVGFVEAETTVVCKKLLAQDLDIDKIPEFAVNTYYKTEAPHTMYIGEVRDIIKR